MQIRRNVSPAKIPFASIKAMLPPAELPTEYRLEDQVGFLIRRVHQRASGIFSRHFTPVSLSTVQFAALVKIRDEGRVSQNQLGRLINLDSATIMGVINRLAERELILRMPDAIDRRRIILSVTTSGLKLLEDWTGEALTVSAETLEPLTVEEQILFKRLLSKLL
jgi:MarR family transcriptional regulator, lower aerobic nicotinate degradation pathway regulator